MSTNYHTGAKRFFRILRLFFESEAGRPAIGWAVVLLVVLLSINGLNVLNSYVGRDFMTSVAARKEREYAINAVLYLGVFLGSTVGAVFARFAEERLRLLWRAWATGTLIDRYLSNRAYYRMTAREEIDNPDQRLTEDVKSFTQTTLSFMLLTLNASLTSLAFLGVLWSITPWLVLVALLYAATGSVVTILLGRRLVDLDNLQLKKEADLRYELIQIRESSATIALMRVEHACRRWLHQRLSAVVENNKTIIAVTRNLGFFTNGYNYLIQLVPLLIVAPMYMRGHVEFGVVTQSAMAFAQVLGALSLIVTQFETLSTFAAVNNRLGMILQSLDQACIPSQTALELVEDNDRLAFEKLSLWTPREHRPLLSELNLSPNKDEHVLISGPSAAAQGALFLAMAGIWEEGEGRIVLPKRGTTFFVPQRPFVDHGTLREQVLINIPHQEIGDEQVVSALEQAGLAHLLERLGGLDAEHNWPEVLSLGEQHLLALARILLSRPRLVVLDRVNAGLETAQLAHFYQVLHEASIRYHSVGELGPLCHFHDTVLELHEQGQWQSYRTQRTRPQTDHECEPAEVSATGSSRS